MARNYYKIWTSRVNLGGNYHSFFGEDEEDVVNQTADFIQQFGGSADWNGKVAYFLVKKEMVVGLLKNWASHYPSCLGSRFRWFQNGLFPTTSPRKEWEVLP